MIDEHGREEHGLVHAIKPRVLRNLIRWDWLSGNIASEKRERELFACYCRAIVKRPKQLWLAFQSNTKFLSQFSSQGELWRLARLDASSGDGPKLASPVSDH